jgi:hypothetical protein
LNYILLEDHDSALLIKKVNALLVAGWQCQGGIGFNAVKSLYLQAMVIGEHILSTQQSNGMRKTTR